jgi:hypothetical protein
MEPRNIRIVLFYKHATPNGVKWTLQNELLAPSEPPVYMKRKQKGLRLH